MPSRAISLRSAALLSAGALAVHELRYLLAYRDHAGTALAEQGHSYLAAVMPVSVGVIVLAISQLLWRLLVGRARAGALPSRTRLATIVTLCLVGVYVAQESVEGVVFAGHPAGLEGVFGHGGWLALPLAVAIGALIALLLHAAARLEDEPPRLRVSLPRRLPQVAHTARPGQRAFARRLHPCASFLAPRAPPRLAR